MAKMKQQWIVFAEEYLKSKDIGKAYALAYNKDLNIDGVWDSCQKSGSRLLKRDEIQNYIKKRNEEIKTENIADMVELQEKLTEIVRMKVEDNPKKIEAVIKAIDTLAKLQGLYDKKKDTDVVEINVTLEGLNIDTDNFEP